MKIILIAGLMILLGGCSVTKEDSGPPREIKQLGVDDVEYSCKCVYCNPKKCDSKGCNGKCGPNKRCQDSCKCN